MANHDIPPDGLMTPPHALHAEQSVLGALMLDNDSWDRIADAVTAGDFFRRDHQIIFRAIANLSEEGMAFDPVTVGERLELRNELDAIGGMPYLGDLARNTPSAANITAYAKLIRETAVYRHLIKTSSDVSSMAFNPEGRSPDELIDYAEQAIFELAERGRMGSKSATPIKELLSRTIDRIDELFHQDSSLTGVPTGYADLDDMTAGLQRSDLIIVAARPSMGKTTFAMNIAEHAAIECGVPTAVFSMEMSDEQLTMRTMSSLGRINQTKVRTGKLDDEDWPRLTSAVSRLAESPLYIDDTPALSPTELRARARRLKREHGIGLIVIDYLQLMQVPGAGGENRAQEISQISRSLKALAKELDVPVVALSQLNRGLESRPNKRPVMSDLRESGAIEQDADVIMFIYRDEVYNEESPDKGTAEIIIGKQRNGEIGMRRLVFKGEFTRFENFAPDYFADAGGYSAGPTRGSETSSRPASSLDEDDIDSPPPPLYGRYASDGGMPIGGDPFAEVDR